MQQQLKSAEDVLEGQADRADARGEQAIEEALDAQADVMEEKADQASSAPSM